MDADRLAHPFESSLHRARWTAIFWVRRPDYPTSVFGSVADGKHGCREQMGIERGRTG